MRLRLRWLLPALFLAASLTLATGKAGAVVCDAGVTPGKLGPGNGHLGLCLDCGECPEQLTDAEKDVALAAMNRLLGIPGFFPSCAPCLQKMLLQTNRICKCGNRSVMYQLLCQE